MIRRRLINQHGYCYRMLCSCLHVSTCAKISKTIHWLTHVLFVALIGSKEKDHAFVNVAQLMAYFISFSINSASEVVRLINICTYLTTSFVTFTRSYWPFQGIQFSSYKMCPRFCGASKGNHGTWFKKGFKFFIHILKVQIVMNDPT